MKKPIICVDFDGVIHGYQSGWAGKGVIPDPPVPGALEWLFDLYERDRLGKINVSVAIYSSRSSSFVGRRAMKRWLKRWLIEKYGRMAGPLTDPVYLDLVEWLKWPWVKPPAIITIDDRAICFEGSFPSLEEVFHFKPWNRR